MKTITKAMKRFMKAHSIVWGAFNPTDEQWDEYYKSKQAVENELKEEEKCQDQK